MTGRITYTPEAKQHLDDLDDWVSRVATPEVAHQLISAVIAHIDRILDFPKSGRARDDVRPGIRTTTYKKRTLIAYALDESTTDVVVTVLGVFHGGRDWSTTLRTRD